MAYSQLKFPHAGLLPAIDERNLINEMLKERVESKLCAEGQSFIRFSNSQPLFPHLPCTADIQQGKIANCFFLTALLAIVAANPHYILNMMRDKGNGTVDVRFYFINPHHPNPLSTIEPRYICVNKSKLVDHRGYPISSHQAPWVFILEKAYAYWRKKFSRPMIIPMQDVLEGNVWVQRPLYPNLEGYGQEPAVTLLEALNSGAVSEAFSHLLGQVAHNQPLQREEIVRTNGGQDKNVYEPLQHLYNVLKILPSKQQQFITSQQIIFGETYQHEINFLLNLITEELHDSIDAYIRQDNHIIRRHALHQLIDTHLAMLKTTEIGRNVREKLFRYVDTHFPEKRGSIDYTHKHLDEFEHIFQLLHNMNIVSVSTHEKIGDPHRHLSRDEGNRVRGLIADHSYPVLDCFKRRNGLYYFLLCNPWRHYGRSYITREGSRDAQHMLGDKIIPIESGSGHWLHAPASRVTRSARGYPNEQIEQLCRNNHGRVFAIELSNLSKRFAHIEWCQLPPAQAAQAAQAVL